jgi:hypothetical protein
MQKRILFVCFSLLAAFFSRAQSIDSWKVYHDKQLIFETSELNRGKNTITLQSADLQRKGYLLITYQQAQPQNAMQRSMAVTDASGKILMQKPNVAMLSLLHSDIKDLSKIKKELRVVTWLLPPNATNKTAGPAQQKILCIILVQ